MLHELNIDDDFSALCADGYVLLDFYASWCNPCSNLAPIIAKIADTYNNVKVIKIDVDIFNELADQFDVMSIPTLVYMNDGQIVESSIGLVSENSITERLAHLLKS